MNHLIALLSVLVMASSPAFAHEGHNEAFKAESPGAAASSTKPIQVDAEGQKAIGLKVQAVQTGGLEKTLQATGRVQAADNRAVDLNPPVSGVVQQVIAKQGDWVSKGQTLATIHSAEIAQTLSTLLLEKARIQSEIATTRTQAQRDIAVKTKDVELARADYQRELTLLNEGIAARKDYMEAKNRYERAQVELSAIKRQSTQQIALLQRQLAITIGTVKSQLRVMGLPASAVEKALSNWQVASRIPIVAPVSGFVTFKDMTLGETVDPTKRIFSIVNLSPIWIIVDVFQNQIPLIHTGQAVRIKTGSAQLVYGKISSIGAALNPDNRTLPVRIVSDNLGGSLKPGMTVKADIITGQSAGRQMVVPVSAVIEESGRFLVYVKEGNAFQPVYIQLGQRTSENVAVLGGLFPGDLVVVQGAKQIYAQRLLGANEAAEAEHGHEEDAPKSDLWLGIAIGLLAAGGLFAWYLFALRPGRR